MKLRQLEIKDSDYMLEWMHDHSVVKDLKTDFATKDIYDCYSFIFNSNNKTNVHFAIVDDKDEYMGTVSLKNIKNNSAEFGIAIRSCAMGKGYAIFAMKSIIDKAFNEYGINKIYWCVNQNNHRALRFYDKHGYKRSKAPVDATNYSQEERDSFVWYEIYNTSSGLNDSNN